MAAVILPSTSTQTFMQLGCQTAPADDVISLHADDCISDSEVSSVHSFNSTDSANSSVVMTPCDDISPIQRYQVTRVLCDSLFGKVMTALDILHNRQVAIKLSNTDLVRAGYTVSGGRVVENPIDEAALLRRIPQHPNVVGLYGEHVLGNVHWMVMEYCAKGEFFDVLARTGAMPTATARRYFKQAVEAAAHIHKHGVCHMDISLENLLLDEHDNIKLTDFGVARALPPKGELMPAISGHKPGKLRYMAPEVLQGHAFCGRRADSFALGVILFGMITGTSPFEAAHPNDRRWQYIASGRLSELLQSIRLHHLVSPAALDLLKGLLAPQESRLTPEQVLTHPFLRDI